MRKHLSDKLRVARVRDGDYGSDDSYGLTGCFYLQGPCGAKLTIVTNDAWSDEITHGWEHVSVSTARRCPNWTEMCFVKSLFWGDEETVVEFHPPKSQWISNHPYVLHLFKPPYPVVLPPPILVGVKDAGELKSPEEAKALRDKVISELTAK